MHVKVQGERKVKKLALFLVGMTAAVVLTGCSLFSSGKWGAGNGNTIQVSETVTHEDPTDLEFVKRYAYDSGEECSISELYEAQFKVKLIREYFVIYGDQEDIPLRAYYYFVFTDESVAKTFAEILEEEDITSTISGNTVFYTEDQETLQMSIESFVAMKAMTEKTAKAYAEMYAKMDELTAYVR